MTTNPPTLPPLPGGKPAVLCAASCQKCAKRGLPWVAVIDTVVDKADAARLAQAGHSYPAAFDPEFAALRRAATVPAARLPGAGFVWVLYEDIGRWDIWETFADGSNRLLLQKVSPQDYAKQSPGLKPSTDEQVCARGAANLGAGFFTISGAISHRSIWLAFTAHLLAPAVLRTCLRSPRGRAAVWAGWDARLGAQWIAVLSTSAATPQTAHPHRCPSGWSEIGRLDAPAACMGTSPCGASEASTHPDCAPTRSPARS